MVGVGRAATVRVVGCVAGLAFLGAVCTYVADCARDVAWR